MEYATSTRYHQDHVICDGLFELEGDMVQNNTPTEREEPVQEATEELKRRDRRPIQLRRRGSRPTRESIRRTHVRGWRCHRGQRGFTVFARGSPTTILPIDTARFAFPNTTRVKPDPILLRNTVSLPERGRLPTSSSEAD